MLLVLVVLLSLLLAAATYHGLERQGRRGVVPATCRTVAYLTLGLLLTNQSCPRPPERLRPIALLDASLSMGAQGGAWEEARAEAARLGSVKLIGAIDPADSTPIGGRSLIAEEVVAATATGRPVWLISDGEVEDLLDIPGDVLERVGVRVFPRAADGDLALTRVDAPERVAAGDTLRLAVEVTGRGASDRKQIGVEVQSGGARWASGTVALQHGSGTVELQAPLRGVAPGDHLIEVALREPGDAEPRTDTRLLVLRVTPTPGVVVVASPPSWESRFLFRALQDVASLPVRGYFAIAGGEWRRMGDLARVSATEVTDASGRADLLALLGDVPEAIRRALTRGRWEWVGTAGAGNATEGDWYLDATGASPVSGAFVGLPVDSFPPATGLVSLTPGARDWVALTGRLNRRGVERAAVMGSDSAGRRKIVVGSAGMWRWAFQGGASEQAYRAWVAASTSWLLGGTDSASGRARPVRTVAQRGRPITFQRDGPEPAVLPIELSGPEGRRTDTLRFDGRGRATLALAPGGYRYELAGGGTGLVAVEEYSLEWLQRPVALKSREPSIDPVPSRAPLREQPWLFGLAVAALAGEWWWRRRAGLR